MNDLHVYLTGYRGCGKSTIARSLALRLNRPRIDLDDWIESHCQQTIAEIFAAQSESGFRDHETDALRVVAALPPHVIALGGGAILRTENRDVIAGSGVCVWLDADDDTLARRIAADVAAGNRRPSLTGRGVAEEVRDVMAVRRPLYRAAANVRVDAARDNVDAIVDDIVRAIDA